MKTQLFTAVLITLILQACAPRQVIVTEYIKTPTFCNVKMPDKPPIKSGSSLESTLDYTAFLSNLKSMMIYTDELEMALLCCTNNSDCISK